MKLRSLGEFCQRHAAGLLLILIAVVSANAVAWLLLDSAAPDAQEAALLGEALRLHAWLSGQASQGQGAELRAGGLLTPLVAALVGLFKGDVTLDLATLPNLAYLAVTMVALYLIGVVLTSQRTVALLACFLFGTRGITSLLLPQLYYQPGLTAMLCCAFLLLLLVRGFEDRRFSVALGLALGLALLTHGLGALYLALPFALTATRAWSGGTGDSTRGARLRNVALSLVLGAAMLGAWLALSGDRAGLTAAISARWSAGWGPEAMARNLLTCLSWFFWPSIELRSMAAVGITSIALSAVESSLESGGNRVPLTSQAATTSGTLLIGDAMLHTAPWPRLQRAE